MSGEVRPRRSAIKHETILAFLSSPRNHTKVWIAGKCGAVRAHPLPRYFANRREKLGSVRFCHQPCSLATEASSIRTLKKCPLSEGTASSTLWVRPDQEGPAAMEIHLDPETMMTMMVIQRTAIQPNNEWLNLRKLGCVCPAGRSAI